MIVKHLNMRQNVPMKFLRSHQSVDSAMLQGALATAVVPHQAAMHGKQYGCRNYSARNNTERKLK
jgi:hypothetical protein